MAKKITQQVSTGRVLVSDGAWGTFLFQKGLQLGSCPELWNIENRDAVLDIARSYIEAGSDLIETNSFGGTSFKLQSYGLEHRVAELNEEAAAISRQAAGKDRIVGASIGPTGQILMMGDVSEEELYEAFKMQAIALERGGADALIIETMSALDEAAIAIQAAKENTACEIVCTMTFEQTVNADYRTMMGVSPSEMVPALIEAGADIIGANCGNGINGMIQIVNEIRNINKLTPILIQANAGLPIYQDGATVYPESPDEMASRVKALIDAGANIIGGCCGTTPAHIHKIIRAIHALR